MIKRTAIFIVVLLLGSVSIPQVLQAELTDAPVRPPVGNAGRDLCSELIGRVAQEHEIRMLDSH